ncbi:hypothetical protein GPALN_002069 [Globodera pallida]|nr:hypothetical protein GPALN_002069 [Globodera pallida]
MSSSRYGGASTTMSSSYQERASPRFVSAISSRHYPGSSDRLHRLASPSSVAFSSSSRFKPVMSSSPRASPVPSSSSTALYGPKRSVSYTSGLALGEGGERHYNYSISTKRTSVGANNGTAASSFMSSSLYDPSVRLRNSPSSSYRTHYSSYSPHNFTAFCPPFRNLPIRPSPLVLTSRSAGNSPPESPPTKKVGVSLIVDEKRGNRLPSDQNDKKAEENEEDELSCEKMDVEPKKRSISPSFGSSSNISANALHSTTPSKSPTPTKNISNCVLNSSKSKSPEPTSKSDPSPLTKVVIPPPLSQLSSGLFTQLEKMIKMSSFDQTKFQRHVRCAVQQKESEEPAEVEGSPSAKVRKSQQMRVNRESPSEFRESPSEEFLVSPALAKRKAHSKSLSPSPNSRRIKIKEENKSNIKVLTLGKRSARRARTVENLMDELQRSGVGGQMTPEGKKQELPSSARNSPNKERSSEPKQQRQLLRAVPPFLLITSPSMGGGDEDEEILKAANNTGGENGGADNEAETSAVLTLAADGDGKEEEEDYTGSSYDEDEEYSDEDYSDEEEWESDEGEWDEATVSRTLQLSGHESDFEFPFVLGPSVVDKASTNVLAPPPIFTASISYDGMSDSWGGRSYSDEGTTNSTSYTEPSGDEVEVGFTLVQQCAMRGSDEEFTTTSSSSSGSYTSGSYTSSFDEEEEDEEHSNNDERTSSHAVSPSHRSRTASSSSGECAESVHSRDEKVPAETEPVSIVEDDTTKVVEESYPVRKSPSPLLIQMAVAQQQEESEQMLEEPSMVEHLDDKELEMSELEECEEEGPDGNREVRREETYVRAQELQEGRTDEAARPLTGQSKPRTDFARKAVVQPMRSEKLSVTEQKPLLAPDEQKIREEEERKKKQKEEEERKKKMKEEEERKKKQKEEEERKKKLKEEEERKKKQKEEEERKKKQKEEEERKKKLKEEEERKKKQKAEEERKTALEDKSAQRKSTLNMREDDRVKAEQAEKESARQKARSSGAVGEAAKQYNETTEDSFAYKRSKALEPKPMDQQKPKRTFKPIQKPDPKAEEAFEKQMAELREQMRQGSRKLQSEFRDVSQGLKSASDDAKLKTKEVQHRSVMDKASSAFGKAEQEKRRLREIQESEAERAKREKGEKERKEHENREKEKAAQTAAKPEPKRTVRRAAKEQIAPQSEDAKKGEEETTRAPPKAKSYWERGTRRKTEELMKFKGTPTVGQAKAEETTKTDVEVPQPKNQPSETKPDEGRSELRRKNRRRCTRRGHRRRPFTRAPFDIDELLDWRGLDTFEKMESFFASRGAEKRPISALTNGGAPAAKRRGTEAQKVWISDLMDIDKLYKASELRDIKMSAGA